MLLNSLSVVSQLAKVSIEKWRTMLQTSGNITYLRKYNANIIRIKFDKSYVNVNHVEPTDTVDV